MDASSFDGPRACPSSHTGAQRRHVTCVSQWDVSKYSTSNGWTARAAGLGLSEARGCAVRLPGGARTDRAEAAGEALQGGGRRPFPV